MLAYNGVHLVQSRRKIIHEYNSIPQHIIRLDSTSLISCACVSGWPFHAVINFERPLISFWAHSFVFVFFENLLKSTSIFTCEYWSVFDWNGHCRRSSICSYKSLWDRRPLLNIWRKRTAKGIYANYNR